LLIEAEHRTQVSSVDEYTHTHTNNNHTNNTNNDKKFLFPRRNFWQNLRHVAFHHFRTDFIHFYLHIHYLQPSIITTTIFRTKNAQETMEIDQFPILPNNRPSSAKKFSPPDQISNPK
jgi:hypothetical protein